MHKNEPIKSVDDYREELKSLREERKELIARNRELLKNQSYERGLIHKGLKSGEKTIPELAEETGLPGNIILYYLSAMRKYGLVKEAAHAGAYYKYRLIKTIKK
jgi:hypothetical protein